MDYDNCDAGGAPKRRAPPKKPSAKAKVGLDVVMGKIVRYCDIRASVKTLDGEKNKLSAELKEAAVNLGVLDPSGSSVLEFPNGAKVANRAKKSQVVDQSKAVALLTKKGLLERCTKRVLDESALELAFQEGLIALDEIDSFTEEKISYAIEVVGPK